MCKPVSSRCRAISKAASDSMLFLRMLPQNEAWLLVLRAGILTADFIRVSVTQVDMMRMKPTWRTCPPSAPSSEAFPFKTRRETTRS